MSASSIKAHPALRPRANAFSISEKGLRVVRGTPLVSEGEGAQNSIAPSTHRRFYNDFRNGTRISQMGPTNFQWDPNLPKGTHIFQMGPYLATETQA